MTAVKAGRDVLVRRALAEIPKLLTLQDRNPHSPTFGCFDRNYWHYRIIDFPSGMAQEFVWPLALVYTLAMPGNRFHGNAALREWIEAGIRYAAASAHRDGSCDDYYPFERATGAAAFSLLACLESYAELGLEDDGLLDFFRRRADWLAGHQESGELSNHEALTALCLARLAAITGEGKWENLGRLRLERVLGWQSDEGWFSEYGGADPGYLTLTISILARLEAMWPDSDLRDPIRRAVAFAAEFVHPDGTFGGEYGSRNTLNFFAHGFELAGRWMPEALAINDRVLAAIADGRSPCYADDHIVGHHMWNDLLAWRDFVAERPRAKARVKGRRHFREAGLLIERRGEATLYVAAGKGGVFKLFRGSQLAVSDTHVSLQLRDRRGRMRTAVAHLAGDYDLTLEEDRIVVSGALGWAKQGRMTPNKMVVLRMVMLSFGRFFPDLVRRLLQRMLIVGKSKAPFSFVRSFTWREDGKLEVVDSVSGADWRAVEAMGAGGHQTSIYVVMSRVFQSGQLQPWRDMTKLVARERKPGNTVWVTREF